MLKNSFITFILFLFSCNLIAQKIKTTSETPSVKLNPFWKSTGYSPGGIAQYKDFQIYLKQVGHMRHNAVKYIRPHYLLDLVGYDPDAKGENKYDWSKLDLVVDQYVNNGFKPIFEMMGNPGGHFNDFQNDTTIMQWHKLVMALAKHLEKRYGKKEVRSWYFESTNEPDRWHFWNHWHIAFLNYYDATSEALLKVDSNITFGGPGAADGLGTYMYLLLDHTVFGKNYITCEKGSRLDFISLHQKSLPQPMIEEEGRLMKHLQQYCRKYLDKPIFNDEADPVAGWGEDYWWRPTPWYASFVAHSVDAHIRHMLHKYQANYTILSNDNTFLGDWYKRTLMTRFIEGDNGIFLKGSTGTGGSKLGLEEDSRPVAHKFYLIKKPVLSVMNLLTYLGDKAYILDSTVYNKSSGAIATEHKNGNMTYLFYNSPQFDLKNNFSKTIPKKHKKTIKQSKSEKFSIQLPDKFNKGYRMISFDIDKEHGNPFGVWKKMGSPEDPDAEQIKTLLSHEDPALTNNSIKNESTLNFAIEPMAVKLVHVFKKGDPVKPKSVKNINATLYSGLKNTPVMLLTWHSSNKRPVYFEIYYRDNKNDNFEKLHDYHITNNHFNWVNCNKKGTVKIVTKSYSGQEKEQAVIYKLNNKTVKKVGE